jgi:hypothetical protein
MFNEVCLGIIDIDSLAVVDGRVVLNEAEDL